MNIHTEAIKHDADVKEFREVLSLAEVRLKKTLRPALIATILLAVCVLMTFLFTAQGPFHRYWQPFGVICDFLSMATLLVMVYMVGMSYNAWIVRRLSNRDFKEFMEDRYGATGK